MVNVDDQLIFEPGQARASNIAAFDDEDRIIITVKVRNYTDLLCSGKLLIGVGNIVANDDFRVFVEALQNPVQGQRRT